MRLRLKLMGLISTFCILAHWCWTFLNWSRTYRCAVDLNALFLKQQFWFVTAGRGYCGIGGFWWKVMVHNLLTTTYSKYPRFCKWGLTNAFGEKQRQGCEEWWGKAGPFLRSTNIVARTCTIRH
jgi:hypothetical protein